MARQSEFDSFDQIELLTRLGESGFEITDSQFARLQPFLVAPYQLQWQLGSLLASVEVIAQQHFHVLAIHDSGNAVVGNVEAGTRVGRGRRYRSLDLACRNFLVMVEGTANE